MNEMNIISAQYVKDLDGNNFSIRALIDDIQVGVPIHQANRHYAEILRQVEAGTLVIADAE